MGASVSDVLGRRLGFPFGMASREGATREDAGGSGCNSGIVSRRVDDGGRFVGADTAAAFDFDDPVTEEALEGRG